MGTLQQKLGFIGPQRCYRHQEVMLKRLSQALLTSPLRSLPYPCMLRLITCKGLLCTIGRAYVLT